MCVCVCVCVCVLLSVEMMSRAQSAFEREQMLYRWSQLDFGCDFQVHVLVVRQEKYFIIVLGHKQIVSITTDVINQ